jgi:hypothetical protein
MRIDEFATPGYHIVRGDGARRVSANRQRSTRVRGAAGVP